MVSGRALDHHLIIDDFVAKTRDLRQFEMTTEDWEATVLVTSWLKSFQSATTQMSTTKQPMLSSTHAIYRGLQDSLCTSLRTLPINVEIFHLRVTRAFGVVVNTPSSALCNEESCGSIPSTSDPFYENSNMADVRRNLPFTSFRLQTGGCVALQAWSGAVAGPYKPGRKSQGVTLSVKGVICPIAGNGVTNKGEC